MVHQTLKDLLKALKGLVVMSEALETMFNSIYNNVVPELWAAKVRERERERDSACWQHLNLDTIAQTEVS